ncbi:MAG: tetratricopeptide repeat protein [Chloroflexota bacterium]
MSHWKRLARWSIPILGFAGLVLAVLALWPTETARQVRAARQALDAGRPLQAAAHFAAAAEADPGQPVLWSQAGAAALAGGDAQLAIHYIERQAQPPLQDQLLLGYAYQKLGDLARATEHYRQAAATGGPAGEAYRALWQIHREKGDYPAMQADLQALVTLFPAEVQYPYRLGLLLAATQPELALPYLEVAVQLDPTHLPAREAVENALRTSRYYDDPAYRYLAIGRALASLGEWELAAEAFLRATAQNEAYGEAWAYLAEARQHLGQDGLAELSRALALAPDSVAVNLLAAFYWQRQGDFDQALAYLDAAARLDPQNPVIQAEIGHTLGEKGDLPVAEAYYRKAIALAPTEAIYSRLLAAFALQHGIQMRAIALPAARQAVLLDPRDPANLDVFAQVLLQLDDPLTAERFLHEALWLAPDDPAVLLHLGQVYWLRGETGPATQKWQQVLVLAPGSAWAQEARRWLER